MRNSSILKKISLLFIGAIFFLSCDKDFNEIGSDIVGEDHFGFEQDSSSTLTAFTKKTGAVETLNLPINPLGVLDNGKFGKTTANFVTQVSLGTENPTFTNVSASGIKSVTLNVPYFSKLKSTNSEGVTTYELDSVYGNTSQAIKLSVYENGYYLRNFDPDNNFGIQRFYSDQNAMFDAVKLGATPTGGSVPNGAPLNDSTDVSQNDSFRFSSAELETPATEAGGDPVKSAPGLRLGLNKDYFYKRIFQNAGSNLLNNNSFQNYFRGLYFKVEETGAGGALALLNFSQGSITIVYEDVTATGTVVKKTLILSLATNSSSGVINRSVSLVTHTATGSSADYEAATGNSITGDEKIFLKGGEGSVAFIDLFGGGNSAELEMLRSTAVANKWLVNEAHVVFNVDQTAMTSTLDPNRIYLYDATNRRSLVDYQYDVTTNNSVPKYSKIRYDGIGQLTGSSADPNRKVKKYRIRVTEHIKNILFKDSTNVRLGLSVTENIANSANSALKTANDEFRNVPTSSVLSPLGTIIYGSNLPDSSTKKMRLVISFTKPD